MQSLQPTPEPTSHPFSSYNTSQVFCSVHHTNSCAIHPSEVLKRDAITIVRILISSLSIFGSLSIILSVLWRRILHSPKIHPIFVISVADCVLGLSWLLGGAMWFGRIQHRSWCYLPSLLTVIMECVCVNLTVVYALVAYSDLKKREISDVLTGSSQPASAWAKWKMVSAYLLAWLVPAVTVLLIFGIVASQYGLVDRATECSCWCFPFFINIIPLAFPNDQASTTYLYHNRVVLLSSSVILLTVYFTGFSILVFMYRKILRHIRKLRESAQAKVPSSPTSYGSVGDLLMRSHSQAKRRVLYFLAVFIATGIANVVLCGAFVVVEGLELHKGRTAALKPGTEQTTGIGPIIVYMAQSLTAPLQGFLNAVVYGWTRDEFVQSRVSGRRRRLHTASVSSDDDTDTSGLVNSGTCDLRDPSPAASGGRERLSTSRGSRERRTAERETDSAVM